MVALALLIGLLSWPATAETVPSKILPKIWINDRGQPKERARLEVALYRIQGSPTARRLEERRQRLGPVTITFAALGNTASGDFNSSSNEHDPLLVRINETLVVSTSGFVETVAHELFGHAVIFGESTRAGAGDYQLMLMEDEAFASTVGNIIAMELGEAPVERENTDAVDAITRSTIAYHAENLFTDSPSTILWSRTEAKNPRAAIGARLAELARRRRSLDIHDKDMALWKWEFDHFERVHKLDPRVLKYVRGSVHYWSNTIIPKRRALLDRAQPHLEEVKRWLESPQGRTYEARLIALSTHPYTLAVETELVEFSRRLAELKARLPAQPQSQSLELAQWEYDFDQISALARRDRLEHPEHWKNAPLTKEPLPWIKD